MNLTGYHAKLFAHELTRRFPADSAEKLAGALVDAQVDLSNRIKAFEALRNGKWRTLFDAQDEIDRRREQLIAEIEGKLQQKLNLAELFRIQWKVS